MINSLKRNIGLIFIIPLIVAMIVFIFNVFIIPYEYSSTCEIQFSSSITLKQIGSSNMCKYLDKTIGLDTGKSKKFVKLNIKKSKLIITATSTDAQLSKKLCDDALLYLQNNKLEFEVKKVAKVSSHAVSPNILCNVILSILISFICINVYILRRPKTVLSEE
jgi:preprotein translocase subunit SecF